MRNSEQARQAAVDEHLEPPVVQVEDGEAAGSGGATTGSALPGPTPRNQRVLAASQAGDLQLGAHRRRCRCRSATCETTWEMLNALPKRPPRPPAAGRRRAARPRPARRRRCARAGRRAGRSRPRRSRVSRAMASRLVREPVEAGRRPVASSASAGERDGPPAAGRSTAAAGRTASRAPGTWRSRWCCRRRRPAWGGGRTRRGGGQVAGGARDLGQADQQREPVDAGQREQQRAQATLG